MSSVVNWQLAAVSTNNKRREKYCKQQMLGEKIFAKEATWNFVSNPAPSKGSGFETTGNSAILLLSFPAQSSGTGCVQCYFGSLEDSLGEIWVRPP